MEKIIKRNEIIELGGKEYTVELNRDSFIQIDKNCHIDKSMQILNRGLYDYVDESIFFMCLFLHFIQVFDGFSQGRLAEILKQFIASSSTSLIQKACRTLCFGVFRKQQKQI